MRSAQKRGRRIGLLLVQYLPENSGSWQVLRALAERLDPAQFRIVLVFPQGGEMPAALPSHITVRYVHVPRLRANFSIGYLVKLLTTAVSLIMMVRRTIQDEKIDVVHCNGLPNIFPAIASVMVRVHLVWHVHEAEFRPRIVFFILRWLCRLLAERIVCVSFAVERLFKQSAKAVLIYNGIDVDRFSFEQTQKRAEPIREVDFPPGTFVVTQLGRIVPIKGVELFVSLAETCVAGGWVGAERLRFVLVGGSVAGHEEYFKDILARISSSPVHRQLIYVPRVEDPRGVLAVTDILVQSSVIQESFGLSLVEAMAMGKPVIASPIGGPAEIIRDGVDGFLVSPYDVSRRAEIIAELFQDRVGLAKLGASGRQRAREKFSADRMAGEFQALYRSFCPSLVDGDG